MTVASIQEYQAIHATVQHYLDGGKAGKGDLMKPAFHADATIFGYIGPDLFAGPIQGLFDWCDQNEPAKDMVAEITVLEIVGTVAVVRAEEDNWLGHRFTTMLNLLQVDGQWKIMNKIFHLHVH